MTTTNMEVDVIIPTFDNLHQLAECVSSLRFNAGELQLHIVVVNNGQADLVPMSEEFGFTLVESKENVGWTSGIALGLKHCRGKYILFCNDDIFVPPSSHGVLHNMVRVLQLCPDVGAVGPASNCVMGLQNIWSQMHMTYAAGPFLIGFFVLYDREKLDAIGGVDVDFQTGDDIDISIRMRDHGYKMLVVKDEFVYHHGFQTGNKVYGDHNTKNGWNSTQMTEKTNTHLIQKHGFMKWWKTMVRPDITFYNDLEHLAGEGSS